MLYQCTSNIFCDKISAQVNSRYLLVSVTFVEDPYCAVRQD